MYDVHVDWPIYLTVEKQQPFSSLSPLGLAIIPSPSLVRTFTHARIHAYCCDYAGAITDNCSARLRLNTRRRERRRVSVCFPTDLFSKGCVCALPSHIWRLHKQARVLCNLEERRSLRFRCLSLFPPYSYSIYIRIYAHTARMFIILTMLQDKWQ